MGSYDDRKGGDTMKDKWIKTVSVLLVVSGMTACGMEQSAKQIAEGTNTAQVDMNDI